MQSEETREYSGGESCDVAVCIHRQTNTKRVCCLYFRVFDLPSLGPHFIRTLLVVGEVAAQVVLALVVLHQLLHLLVPGVPLEVGVGTGDGPLQVIQLGGKTVNYPGETSDEGCCLSHFMSDASKTQLED